METSGNAIRHAPTLAPCDPRSVDDKAWDDDVQPTNYKLCDGDTVELNVPTRGDFSAGYFLVPSGTLGKVVHARTPRVVRRPGTKSAYFANVDVEVDGCRGRIRVPHGVLKRVKPAEQQ